MGHIDRTINLHLRGAPSWYLDTRVDTRRTMDCIWLRRQNNPLLECANSTYQTSIPPDSAKLTCIGPSTPQTLRRSPQLRLPNRIRT